MSRLEAGRRYRRVYCLTLGICYNDAVLMLCWGCGRPGADWTGPGRRRREAAGEEGTASTWGEFLLFLRGNTVGSVVAYLIGLLVPGVGEWGCSGGGRMRDFQIGRWGHVLFRFNVHHGF